MKWTDKQYEAITNRGKNLLVAAAAGSGKTAVLVERIKTLILKDGCPIDRMLVVTFTNAAASEMKEKIERAIREEITSLNSSGDEGRTEKISLLKRQLDLLPQADISTFHAFSMEVVRRFFYLIGCEPNFKICDEGNKVILEDRAMEKLLERRYDEGAPEFYSFLDKFSTDRNDERIRRMVQDLSTRMEAIPDPDEWLERKTAELALDREDFASSTAMDVLWKDAGKTLENCLEIMEGSLRKAVDTGLTQGAAFAAADKAKIEELLVPVRERDYDKTALKLNEYKADTLRKEIFSAKANPGVRDEELEEVRSYIDSARKSVKEAIKGLKEGVFNDTLDQMYEGVKATRDDVLFLGGLTREYREIFSEIKRSKGLIDFSDLEHFAYEILKNEEAAGYYREKFRHIFVDEYQDSNVLQEALIGRIAGKNNLFTVGDVKQSIYRFRLAEPEIFEARYKKYKEESARLGSESDSLKIDLNRNFRSKESIIDFVNRIFSRVMEGYGKDEALYAGDPSASLLNREPALYLTAEDWNEGEELDDAIKELKKAEKEALLTVKLIKDSLGKNIFDSKEGRERPLTKKDIVILMRGIKNRGDVFYKVLMENNIPCFVDDNKGYFDTIEINTFMSLLNLIDNMKQDVHLITVMRSEIMGFTISELAEIRACHKEGSYFDCVKSYGTEGADPVLRDKCLKIPEKLGEWRTMAETMPLEELIWKLMTDTGFYASMGAMPGGSVRQANLRLLADKALDYRRNQGSGLYDFIRYVDHIKDKEIKMGQARIVTEDEDTVRIMTIHHSKGLEFPMVIISGYTRRLNGDKAGSGLVTDKDLGIGLSLVVHKENWYRDTFLQKMIRRKALGEEIREEERILYVAMTRAKDILLMTGTAKDPEALIEKAKTSLRKNTTYFDMTGGILAEIPGGIRIVDDRDLGKIAGMRKRSVGRALEVLDREPGARDPETDRIMRFEYPYADELLTKSKYSVSELNSRDFEKETVFDPSVPREPEKAGLSAAHKGTVIHSILERMDFGAVCELGPEEGEALISGLISDMVREEFLTEEESHAADPVKLYDFAVSPLGRRMGLAQKRGQLFREKPFNLRMEVDGKEALVQGMIDCFFVEDGKAVLVDYKNSVSRDLQTVKKRYRTQMSIYRKALTAATGLEVRESCLYLTDSGMVADMDEEAF